MLTDPCVMFFSPSRAVLSAILRDEYLTSAVGTKEGDLLLLLLVRTFHIHFFLNINEMRVSMGWWLLRS